MEPAAQAGSLDWGDIGAEFHRQSGEAEPHRPISVPQENVSSSFTALLELPANQAMELLVHSTDEAAAAAAAAIAENPSLTISAPPNLPLPIFPSNAALLVDGDAKFSPLANSDRKLMANSDSLKLEEAGSDSDPKSNSYPNRLVERKLLSSTKRKEREKTEKEGSKKCKKAGKVASKEGAEKPPYVHVRARRGQATDSHSLAERARREKINAKMKLLQEMVPGCNKISGTALVLDEIINHVQSLQRQIEILSMRLASINPTSNFSFETLMNDEDGSALDSNFPGMVMPSNWHEEQVHKNGLGYKQFWHTNNFHQLNLCRENEHPDFAIPENSPLTYGYSGNSAPLHMNQLKMEL